MSVVNIEYVPNMISPTFEQEPGQYIATIQLETGYFMKLIIKNLEELKYYNNKTDWVLEPIKPQEKPIFWPKESDCYGKDGFPTEEEWLRKFE